MTDSEGLNRLSFGAHRGCQALWSGCDGALCIGAELCGAPWSLTCFVSEAAQVRKRPLGVRDKAVDALACSEGASSLGGAPDDDVEDAATGVAHGCEAPFWSEQGGLPLLSLRRGGGGRALDANFEAIPALRRDEGGYTELDVTMERRVDSNILLKWKDRHEREWVEKSEKRTVWTMNAEAKAGLDEMIRLDDCAVQTGCSTHRPEVARQKYTSKHASVLPG